MMCIEITYRSKLPIARATRGSQEGRPTAALLPVSDSVPSRTFDSSATANAPVI